MPKTKFQEVIFTILMVFAMIPVWLQTVALNFPMAFFWQICYADPFVRFIFKLIFSGEEHVKEAGPEA